MQHAAACRLRGTVSSERDEHAWVERIAGHRKGQAAPTRELLWDTLRFVARVSRRYPPVYFELCERNDESLESLGHHVFARLDGRAFGRFPFSGRVPFDAFLEDLLPDRDVRWHSFESRLSVTREALREQYAFNVRHHPDWAERERLHREVVAALREVAVAFPGRSPRWPRWGLPSWGQAPRGPRADWDREETVRLLSRREGWPVESRVQLVLARHGAPMYPGAISALLQDASVRGARVDRVVEDESGGTGEGWDGALSGAAGGAAANSEPGALEPARLTVRRRVAEGWAALLSEERELLALLVAGRPYREIVERVPRYRDPSAVTRALARICEGLLRRVVEALDESRAGSGAAEELRPQQVAELIFPLLLDLPDVRARIEQSHV
jgi:hypothetical protein